MEWLKQFSNAIDYIENNLDNDISYEEAAKLACCSTYYFQRMFTYVVGISLSDYIRRRRMTKAAFELQSTKKRILDIGSKYGYVSPTSFNRAFQKIHGVAPSVARLEGTELNSYPRISFSINVTGKESLKYRIETKDSIRILGKRVKMSNDIEINTKIAPKFWNELSDKDLNTLYNLSNKYPFGLLGLSVYHGPDDIYYYISVSTTEEDDNFYEYTIPSATWVVFECNGNYSNCVKDIFKRFYTEWLPFSGYEYAHLPDIEVYPLGNKKMAKGHSEIWIAIKNKEE